MEKNVMEQAKLAQLEKTNPNAAFIEGMKQKEGNYEQVLTSQKPVSGCEVEAGTIIPAVLLSRINSNLPGFIKAVGGTLRIACMVLTLIAGATILGHFFAVTRTPYMVAEWLTGLHVDRSLIMLIIIAVYLIGGSFIEHLAFLILATPIFLPVVLKLGYDPVWFGVIVGVVTMIGVILPPMGINVFVVSGVTGESTAPVYRGSSPYIIGMSICLLILLFFPGISLWLPNLFIR
jgi:TRAP-type C4-dicarboxylate transport system permease large subunit